MLSSWNPWRELSTRTHLTVRWVDGGRRGCINYATNVIVLRRSMRFAERRSVVTHELVHDERGPVPKWLEPREEAAVRCESARRLIELPDLAAALQWTSFITEAAAELNVDVPTLQARLVNLTDEERAHLSDVLTEVPHVGHNDYYEEG